MNNLKKKKKFSLILNARRNEKNWSKSKTHTVINVWATEKYSGESFTQNISYGNKKIRRMRLSLVADFCREISKKKV